MIKRVRLLMLSFIILFLLPFLCSAQTPNSTESSLQNSTESSDIVNQAIGAGEIKIGTVLNCPPFAFKDEKGEPSGFCVDIANILAETLNVKLAITEVNPAELIDSFAGCNIVIANIPRTLELAKFFSFTDPYFQSGQVVIVNERNLSVNNYNELDTDGKKIVVIEGSAGMQAVDKKFKKASRRLASNEQEAVVMLLGGVADAFVYDRHLAEFICISHPELKMLPGQLSNDFYCFILLKDNNKDNTSITWFNIFISDLKLSKKYIEVFNKWFGPKL